MIYPYRVMYRKTWIFLLLLLAITSCNKKKVYIKSDFNTIGVKHSITYKDELPIKIEYNTFVTKGYDISQDNIEIVRVDIDSIIYDFDKKTIQLLRIHDFKEKIDNRKYKNYYFNEDHLLYKITRFDSDREYEIASVIYDFDKRKVVYHDFINHNITELYYNKNSNIEKEIERKISDSTVVGSALYKYDNYNDPFLYNLPENEKLFGCFNIRCVGIFWNSFSKPLLCSRNNIIEVEDTYYGNESVVKYSYEYKDGFPKVRYGGFGVLYNEYGLQ